MNKPRKLEVRGKDRNLLHLPIPISAALFMEGIEWSLIGSVTEELAKMEMKRMFDVYQRWRAWLQPTLMINGEVWYEVQFPGAQPKYKSGPVRAKASEAMDLNFRLNKKFPGQQELKQGEGDSHLRLDEILDEGIKRADQNLIDFPTTAGSKGGIILPGRPAPTEEEQ